jgi:hypothetical protein
MQTNTAEKQTINWLKQNGLNDSYFETTDLLFVQAQQIAHNILKHHQQLLKEAQIKTLKDYLNKIHNKAKRKTLTANTAYKVMTIGKQINRRLFKAYKAINSR